MNYFNLLSRCFLMLLILIGSVAFADGPPRKLNYQGVLTSSTGGAITSPVNVTFSLYNVPTSGTAFWTETQSVTLANDGRFSVVLGSTTPMDPALFTGKTYIGVKVGSDTEMPRQQLTSVAYALTAQRSLDTVQIPKGVIVMWSGTLATIPAGWALCDGNNGTPNLKDKFVVGAGGGYAAGATGGEAAHVLTIDEMPSHNHGGATGGESASHTHYDAGHAHQGWLTSVNRDGTSGTRVREADDSSSGTGGIGFHTDTGYSNLGTESAAHTHAIPSQGNGWAFENRPPYYALAYIMKL